VVTPKSEPRSDAGTPNPLVLCDSAYSTLARLLQNLCLRLCIYVRSNSFPFIRVSTPLTSLCRQTSVFRSRHQHSSLSKPLLGCRFSVGTEADPSAPPPLLPPQYATDRKGLAIGRPTRLARCLWPMPFSRPEPLLLKKDLVDFGTESRCSVERPRATTACPFSCFFARLLYRFVLCFLLPPRL